MRELKDSRKEENWSPSSIHTGFLHRSQFLPPRQDSCQCVAVVQIEAKLSGSLFNREHDSFLLGTNRVKVLLRYSPRGDLVRHESQLVWSTSTPSERRSGDGPICESTERDSEIVNVREWPVFACDMGWEDVGSSGEEGKVCSG